MIDPPPAAARVSPAVGRNRDPILEVLRRHLPATGLVLEVAAGSGEHAVYFASAMAHLQWRPSDADPDALASIASWRAHGGSSNLLAPLRLDAGDPASWPIDHADAVVCINMVHISPWTATTGLMAGAGRVLPSGGLLFLYGPYLEPEVAIAPTNVDFDLSLKSRNSLWGLRSVEEVSACARDQGLILQTRLAMPANNLSLIYRKGMTVDPTSTSHRPAIRG